jgi:hypothetical protein
MWSGLKGNPSLRLLWTRDFDLLWFGAPDVLRVTIALLALAVGGVSVEVLAFVQVRFAVAALLVVMGWSAASFDPVVISPLRPSWPGCPAEKH